jgi:peptidyl-tRNA hydrolase
MRFYSLTNLYTAGIHAGIQTAHAVHAMERKYALRSSTDDIASLEKLKVYQEWADRHQTIIVLQAGYAANLERLYNDFRKPAAELNLPIIRWRESKEALNGATTAVGIVLPESVYDMRLSKDQIAPEGYRSPEEELYALIYKYPMAV